MTTYTTNPKDYIELLEVFHIGLIHGIIDRQEIIKWADNIIQSDAEPDYFVIELSLTGQKNSNEITALLKDYTGDRKTLFTGRVLLGLLYAQLKDQQISLEKAVRSVNWLIWQSNLKEKDKRFFYRLEDLYDLAVDGITGSIDTIQKYTCNALELYSAYTLANFTEWEQINAEVDIQADTFDGWIA